MDKKRKKQKLRVYDKCLGDVYKIVFFKKLGLNEREFTRYTKMVFPKRNYLTAEESETARKVFKDAVEKRAKVMREEREEFERELKEKRRNWSLCNKNMAWLNCDSEEEFEETIRQLKEDKIICLEGWRYSHNFRSRQPQKVGLKIRSSNNKIEHFANLVSFKRKYDSNGRDLRPFGTFWIKQIEKI